MAHALPHSLPATAPEPSLLASADDTAAAEPWRTRVWQLLRIDFAELDELDLGTRSEFNSYVSGLFERRTHDGS